MNIFSLLFILCKNVYNFIFPNECIICEKIDSILCHNCLQKLDWAYEKRVFMWQDAQLSCHYYANYYGVIRALLLAVKQDRRRDIMIELAKYVSARVSSDLLPFFTQYNIVFVMVPSTSVSYRQRGFSPVRIFVLEVVKSLINDFNIPKSKITFSNKLVFNNFIKQSNQKLLGRSERVKNIFYSMRYKNKLSSNDLIVIFDDIVTTGASIVEASRAIRAAGANKIIAICFSGVVKKF